MSSVSEPTPRELELASQLREAALAEVDRRGLDEEQLAELLGVPSLGAYVVRRRSRWSLPLAIRVAEALGIEVDIAIQSSNGSPDANPA